MPSKFEIIIEDIKAGVVSHEQNKKEQIESARDALVEVNFKEDRICSKICEELKGYVKARYIREVLEAQYKDQAKVRTPKVKQMIGVTNAGEIAMDKGAEVYSPSYARVAKASKEMENQVKVENDPSTGQIVQLQQALRDAKEIIAEQSSVISKLKDERELHTTVSLNRDKYPEVVSFMNQKASRIFFDFDDNMVVKNVRASI